VRECAGLGIRHVWMHRGMDGGSVSRPAAEYGRQQGITAGAAHKMMRFAGTLAGTVPRRVQRSRAAGAQRPSPAGPPARRLAGRRLACRTALG
jgi:hypothetical protein